MGLAPVEQRVDLDDATVQRIQFDRLKVRPGHAVLTAHAGDPPGKFLQRTPERLHLADVAALVAVLQRLAEGEEPLLALQLFHRFVPWEIPVDLGAVALRDGVGHLVGLLIQPAGVEREDADLQTGLLGQLDDGHVLEGERAGELHGTLRCGHTETENLLGGCVGGDFGNRCHVGFLLDRFETGIPSQKT